jgi:myo-inositol 2-dehydrogenase/D-chiro-inositol 1-dehydrogenase
MPLATLRLGIVGLGAVTQLVYEPILRRRTDLFHTAAVAELSPTARHTIGLRLGVAAKRRHGSVEEMVTAGGLDAVLVLSSGSHGQVVEVASAAGLPVFVEKPLAWTHGELDQLEARAHLIQVGYMKRFDPAYQRLQELLTTAGPVRAVDVTVLHPADARQVTFRGGDLVTAVDIPAEVRANQAMRSAELERQALGDDAATTLGGVYSNVLLGSLIHDLAVIRPLVGNPQEITWARVWPFDWDQDRLSIGVDSDLVGGAQLTMRWHYIADYPTYDESVRIHTESGTYTLNFPIPYLMHAPTVLTVTSAQEGRIDAQTSISHLEAFELQLEDFHTTVIDQRPPTIGIEEARADIVTCQRIASALAASLRLSIGGEAAKDARA